MAPSLQNSTEPTSYRFSPKKDDRLTRTKKLFWDWGDGIALQDGDWKIHRYGKQLALFNIQQDPNEYFNLQLQEPARFQEMQAALMQRYNSLPEDGKSKLREKEPSLYVKGAPTGTPVDPRFTYPYQNAKPTAYPVPLSRLPRSEKSTTPSH